MRDGSAPPHESPATEPGFLGAAVLVGLAVALAAIFLLGWLASEVIEGETLAFDTAVRVAVHRLASPTATSLFRTITLVGSPSVLGALGLVAVVIFAIRRWWRGVALYVVAMAGAGLLDTALKLSFHRARPAPYFGYTLPSSYSFPSGHALFSLVVLCTAATLLSPRLVRWPARVAVWAVAVGLSLLVGLSRIYLGVHYPSDVLAGYAAGAAWVATVALGDRAAHARARRRGGA